MKTPQAQLKRVNLKIIQKETDIFSLENIALLNNIHPELFIRVALNQEDLFTYCQEKGFKFFFDYDFNINSFCRLQDALEQNVSDVYIMEDLCYRLPQVRALCDQYNVQIRLVANTISSFTINRGTDVTAPFFVPENIDKIAEYYNVIEFELFNSWNRFDTLYKIWFEDKEWRDDLRFINFELEESIPGESFPRELCEYKMTCGHRCVERQVNCKKCEHFMKFARTMASKNLRYTKDQKWVEIDKNEDIKDIF